MPTYQLPPSDAPDYCLALVLQLCFKATHYIRPLAVVVGPWGPLQHYTSYYTYFGANNIYEVPIVRIICITIPVCNIKLL